MIVFVVTDHFIESVDIVRVFSTREKAETFIKAHQDEPISSDPPFDKISKYDSLAIEEYALD